MDIHIPILVAFVGLLAPSVVGQCDDLDRQACVLLENSNPNLCQDPSLSRTACPRYCNLCPLTCYNCEQTTNAALCNSTQQCDYGQQCMLTELSSTVDGHHEYSQKCAGAQECDGKQYSSAVIGRRDMSYHCCDKDLCNTPVAPTAHAPTTTSTTTKASVTTTVQTTCRRDILVLMEDAIQEYHQHYMFTNMKNLLISMVHDMDIGPDANLFQVAVFDGHVHHKFSFEDSQTKSQLLYHLNNMNPHHQTNYVDVNSLLNFLKSWSFSAGQGDRPSVPNDIIIFVDHRLHASSSHISASDFRHQSGDVIVVDIGGNGASTPFDAVATDANHVLHADAYNMLYEIKPQLMELLCK